MRVSSQYSPTAESTLVENHPDERLLFTEPDGTRICYRIVASDSESVSCCLYIYRTIVAIQGR